MTTKKTTLEFSNKSLAVALILWFLLALTGAHRMYMGKMGSGLSQLMLLIISLATMVVLVGYVLIFIAIMWWLIDVYVIFKFFNSIEGSTNLLSTSQHSVANNIDSLEKIHSLFTKGVIDQEEYSRQKADLLKR